MNIDQDHVRDLSSDELEVTLQQLVANPSVRQHIVRTVSAGIDQIAAYYRLTFAPDETRKALHVSIHPAMEQVPEVQAIGIDQEVRIRVTESRRYGVRVEVILPDAPVNPTTALVEIILSSEVTE